MPTPHGIVVVQHSGYGYAGNPEFQQGLELRDVQTVRDRRMVERCGGRLFSSRREAEEWTELEMYPPGYEGLVPEAPGTFSATASVDGLAVYQPAAGA